MDHASPLRKRTFEAAATELLEAVGAKVWEVLND
jgi:hypothetical protein